MPSKGNLRSAIAASLQALWSCSRQPQFLGFMGCRKAPVWTMRSPTDRVLSGNCPESVRNNEYAVGSTNLPYARQILNTSAWPAWLSTVRRGHQDGAVHPATTPSEVREYFQIVQRNVGPL